MAQYKGSLVVGQICARGKLQRQILRFYRDTRFSPERQACVEYEIAAGPGKGQRRTCTEETLRGWMG